MPDDPADPIDLHNPSFLEGFLRWLSRPGYAARDALTGNIAGAGRQLADLALEPLDVLPGVQVPQIARKGDYTEASDLVGGMDDGWMKTGVDIVGGALTDPLTYTGVGPLKAALEVPIHAAAKGAAAALQTTAAGTKALGAIESGIKNAGATVRAATGNLKPSPVIGSAVQAGEAAGSATAKAGQGFAVGAFSKLDPVTQRRAIETVRGVTSELSPGTYTDLDAMAGVAKPASPFVDKAAQMARIDQRLAAMPWSADEKAAVRQAAEQTVDFTRGQWAQGIKDKVFTQVEHPDLAPADYLPGAYEMDEAAKEAAKQGAPSIIGEKAIRSSADLADYLNANKATLDSNLPALLGDYGSRMGSAVKSAEIGQRIAPGFRSLAEDRGLFKPIIENLRSQGLHDDATVLDTAVNGLPPREGIMKIMADFNTKFFKPFATGGAFIPRAAFATRNEVSSAWQAASNPATRGAAAGMVARIPGDLAGAWADGARALGMPMAKPEHVQQIEAAIAQSGGQREAMLAAIKDPTLQEAVRQGVIDGGFVTSEKMGANMAQQAAGAKDWKNWRDWPQAITKGSEERMRLGLFSDLMDKGMSGPEAAKAVKDSLFDYAYSSKLNRTMRNIIPFFQYSAKAVPQQLNFLMESGAVPSLGRHVAEALYGNNEQNILPPQLQNSAALPLGRDQEGNPEYATSFGLPFESIAQVPDPFRPMADMERQLRQDVVAAASPPLKTAYSLVSGKDPYFDTPFGSYDRAPYLAQELGADPHSHAARLYNLLAGSGAIQPVAAPISALSGLMDPRRTAAEAAINALTGVRIKSVDEQRALQQLLEEKLQENPDVQTYTGLYQNSPDEQTQAMLQELKRIKADMRKRKKTEKSATSD